MYKEFEFKYSQKAKPKSQSRADEIQGFQNYPKDRRNKNKVVYKNKSKRCDGKNSGLNTKYYPVKHVKANLYSVSPSKA